ncbi:hypothetical protein COL26b_008832 [Colletotrichum chrysophilum]|uniref:uncharacterized protein n=1 Tax=Colletotrichum chrysophilum TaxID=1836956 RepID=UPI002300DB57|nr:uncharacterized protein COL26b_008832 [Colletotrichum chrysophilum]KAJ0372955.1 hypothetical protein COL26b_008832 [Colletotrichum chrysophilum]
MQNLAPIHLLQSRDGPLDRWRGGLWGMSHSVAHTPLETLFLFQELARTGITTDGFDRAAKALVENELINTDASYDAARLTPDALRQLFLNVWTEELATANGTTTSPNSKRRKLNRPPVPTLKEAKQQVAEYPALVERLYARWRDSAVKSIREQEERLIVLAGEITSLDAEERAEKAEKAKAAAPPRPPAPNGTPGPKTTPTPVPVPSTLPNPVQAAAAQPQVKPPAPAPHCQFQHRYLCLLKLKSSNPRLRRQYHHRFRKPYLPGEMWPPLRVPSNSRRRLRLLHKQQRLPGHLLHLQMLQLQSRINLQSLTVALVRSCSPLLVLVNHQ